MKLFKKTKNGKDDPIHCSFCGKEKEEVIKMISGPSVFICDECVDLCNDIVAGREPIETKSTNQILAPFSHEGTVKFSVSYDQSLDEVHISLNQMACIAFSNIFTQLGIIEFGDDYSVDMSAVGYETQGKRLRISTSD